MCDICNHTPCLNLCPNAKQPKPAFACVECGKDIYPGDNYYDLFGEPFCEECNGKLRKTAEGDY